MSQPSAWRLELGLYFSLQLPHQLSSLVQGTTYASIGGSPASQKSSADLATLSHTNDPTCQRPEGAKSQLPSLDRACTLRVTTVPSQPASPVYVTCLAPKVWQFLTPVLKNKFVSHWFIQVIGFMVYFGMVFFFFPTQPPFPTLLVNLFIFTLPPSKNIYNTTRFGGRRGESDSW